MTQRCTWPIKRTLVSKNSKFTIQIYTYVILFAYIQMQKDVVKASEALLPVVRSVVSIKFQYHHFKITVVFLLLKGIDFRG